MPNSKLYNVKTTLTDGTVIDSGTIEVPQGENGDTGLSALECSFSGNSPISPVVGGSVTIPKDNFNREPIVGDIAIYTWKNSSTNQSYVVSGKCTVSNPGLDKRFQIESFIETTGENGNDALVMKTSFSSSMAPTNGASYYFPDTSFNRKPVAGEFCTMTWIDTSANDTYTCICSVDSYTSEAQLSVMSFRKISARPLYALTGDVALSSDPVADSTVYLVNQSQYQPQDIKMEIGDICQFISHNLDTKKRFYCVGEVTQVSNNVTPPNTSVTVRGVMPYEPEILYHASPNSESKFNFAGGQFSKVSVYLTQNPYMMVAKNGSIITISGSCNIRTTGNLERDVEYPLAYIYGLLPPDGVDTYGMFVFDGGVPGVIGINKNGLQGKLFFKITDYDNGEGKKGNAYCFFNITYITKA